ncbi:MAG: hypothetical protein KDA88_22335 [Planctomycetaceae bacterium]|nr:hypothetical protein [Planctomycetaceae bacterium]MCA9030393.1 hypothetical protein [Planctomycetaceae bacterium]MCB9952755.1 hypothetical protein [Planctomycetaceae bacterium]
MEDSFPDYKTREDDIRVYFPHHEEWTIHIKRTWEKQYCYAKCPGEDYFHAILAGEIYIQRGDEKYCLDCALRHGFLTQDRLFWQRGPRPPKKMPM